MCEIAFDLHGPGWTLTELSEVLAEFSNMFSEVLNRISRCSLLLLMTLVSPNSSPVTCRPYRINPPIATLMDAVLDKFRAVGFIQHPTSPWASPVVVIPTKTGSIRITVNCKKLNKLSVLGELPTSRIDDVLDEVGTGRIFSLFDLVSSFDQITVMNVAHPRVCSSGWIYHKEAALLQGGSSRSSTSLSKALTASLPTSTSSCSTPTPLFTPHIRRTFSSACETTTSKFSFKCYNRRHGCEFPRSHHLSRRHHTECTKRGSTVMKRPMSENLKQLRSLVGDFSYYRKFLPDMAKRKESALSGAP